MAYIVFSWVLIGVSLMCTFVLCCVASIAIFTALGILLGFQALSQQEAPYQREWVSPFSQFENSSNI